MKLALVIGLIAATSATAAPIYVGENIQSNRNSISLGFMDAPTKKSIGKTTGTTVTDTGNIAAVDLKANYRAMDNVAVRGDLPFYMASKYVTGNSKSSLGNINLGGAWSNTMQSSDRAWTYGVSLAADVYVPTSRKDQGNAIALANPTTDFYRYNARSTSLTPTLGFFMARDQWSAKSNVGYGYTMIQKKANSPTDTARNSFTYQLAASYHAMPNLNLNLEYNTIMFDKETSTVGTLKRAKFRQAITPSISGNFETILASAYVAIPVDPATRDVSNMAFGLNAGYSF